jgi:D-beta-D-heptose 7-phosphate kinase/D-beta-D-heptose 1-phosphate adenosyltransferase
MLIKEKLSDKILTQSKLIDFISVNKNLGKKIVFTNGCFDLVHLGHIEYLMRSKELGDVLIVGVNSDQSVQSIKGPSRPIMPEEHRYHNLAAYYFIDAVVPFNDETPLNLIKTIKPDILVKGSDYKPEDVVGYDVVMNYGGEVICVDTSLSNSEYSTTKIISKIRSLYD